jgi:hypothetical protein
MIRLPDLIPEGNGDVNSPHSFRQKDLKTFIFGFKGLQGCIPDILCFYLGTVEHLVASAIRCLWMIVSFRVVDFLPLTCFGSHFQDHSVMGRSAVRNTVTGILVDSGIHYDHGLVVFRFQQPVITNRINIKRYGFLQKFFSGFKIIPVRC